jgi:hypothetical protein
VSFPPEGATGDGVALLRARLGAHAPGGR